MHKPLIFKGFFFKQGTALADRVEAAIMTC
jgi:hypothetical protein